MQLCLFIALTFSQYSINRRRRSERQDALAMGKAEQQWVHRTEMKDRLVNDLLQYLVGRIGIPKLNIACQSPHLLEIQDIESISEPPLPKVIYTICQNLSLDDFRK